MSGLGIQDINDATLVSSTDGVGTKVKIAQAINKYDTIGIDLVAMCVNDLLCQGASPMFFLDYIACGKLENLIVKDILDGIVEGCKLGNMSLIGGETAEMPGVYSEGCYDLAGFSVGVVNKNKILPNVDLMDEGDILIGLHSSGLHSNGFSLARKILEVNKIEYTDECELDSSKNWGEFLLTPTKIYVDICGKLNDLVKGFAHITGGGITENLPRVLPNGFVANVRRGSWPVQKIFDFLQEKGGNIDLEEMCRVFNMGIGMILVCSKNNINSIKKILDESGNEYSEIGYLTKNSDGNADAFVEYC
jgi:phosphoribosylaminoimidazole synthetase